MRPTAQLAAGIKGCAVKTNGEPVHSVGVNVALADFVTGA